MLARGAAALTPKAWPSGYGRSLSAPSHPPTGGQVDTATISTTGDTAPGGPWVGCRWRISRPVPRSRRLHCTVALSRVDHLRLFRWSSRSWGYRSPSGYSRWQLLGEAWSSSYLLFSRWWPSRPGRSPSCSFSWMTGPGSFTPAATHRDAVPQSAHSVRCVSSSEYAGEQAHTRRRGPTPTLNTLCRAPGGISAQSPS